MRTYEDQVYCRVRHLRLNIAFSFLFHISVNFLETKAVQTYKGTLPAVTLNSVGFPSALQTENRRVLSVFIKAASWIHMTCRIRWGEKITLF